MIFISVCIILTWISLLMENAILCPYIKCLILCLYGFSSVTLKWSSIRSCYQGDAISKMLKMHDNFIVAIKKYIK